RDGRSDTAAEAHATPRYQDVQLCEVRSVARRIEEAVVPFRHRRMREGAEAESAPDARLLLAGLAAEQECLLGVLAVFFLGLDMYGPELHRLIVDVVVLLQSFVDDLGAVRASGHLHLDREAEGSEALLERVATIVAHGRGGTDGRRQRRMVEQVFARD